MKQHAKDVFCFILSTYFPTPSPIPHSLSHKRWLSGPSVEVFYYKKQCKNRISKYMQKKIKFNEKSYILQLLYCMYSKLKKKKYKKTNEKQKIKHKKLKEASLNK